MTGRSGAIIHRDGPIVSGGRGHVSPEVAVCAVARERPHAATDCVFDLEGLQRAIELQRVLGAFDHPLRAADIIADDLQPSLVS